MMNVNALIKSCMARSVYRYLPLLLKLSHQAAVCAAEMLEILYDRWW